MITWTCGVCGDVKKQSYDRCSHCGKGGCGEVSLNGKPDAYQQAAYQRIQRDGPSKQDCQITDHPVCPYCGNVHMDYYPDGDDGNSFSMTCTKCEEEFEVEVEWTPSYTTAKRDEAEVNHE